MGPTGPRWAPCRPHEPCYLGYHVAWVEFKSTHYDSTTESLELEATIHFVTVRISCVHDTVWGKYYPGFNLDIK